MLFDAGRWGMVDVDIIEHHLEYTVGIKYPDDYDRQIIYRNYGKQGCSKVAFKPRDPISEEQRLKNRERIIDKARAALQNAECRRLKSMNEASI